MNLRRVAPLVLLAIAASPSPAQLTDGEKKGLADSLYVGNMALGDLVFARRPFADVHRMPIVDLAIDKPIESADKLLALHKTAGGLGLGQLLDLARLELFSDKAGDRQVPAPDVAPPSDAPAELRETVAKLIGEVWIANEAVTAALGNLTEAELATLIQGLPGHATEEPSIKFGWVTMPQPSQAEIVRLVSRVNLASIRDAGARLARAIDQHLPKLKEIAAKSQWKGIAEFRHYGLNVVVAGVGDDTHRSLDSHLTIDLGGNDRYLGRAGGGLKQASVLVDLGGDDNYKVPDLSAGAGLLGVGLAYDLGGLDTLRGKSLCFGAGLAGVGAFLKDGGHDYYSSVSLAQGFGQFGIGVLLDTRGGDSYEVGLYGQGASRTQGTGWLVDRSGNDVYKAGGLILNSPLFADVYYSMAQGYSGGYRDDGGGVSGGVGLITDLAGDDAYLGATYCQAASYWFALGSLYDAAGHDSYRAYHYAQSSAMHMTAAYLFDLAGDDLYSVNFGAAHSIGHDYGTSFLLDRLGNDVYAAKDSAPGIGNANGVGVFLEVAGDDRYAGPPAIGNPARGSGSLGVFADLGGQDLYRTGLADSQARSDTEWAMALDSAPPVAAGGAEATAPVKEPSAAGSKPMPPDADLEALYKRATQWGVGTAQQDVAEAIDTLGAIGFPAFKWMVDTHLAGASRLEQRAFVEVANRVKGDAYSLVASKVASPNTEEARVAILICVDGQIKEAAPYVPKALEVEKLARNAARLAGVVQSKESVPQLMVLTANQDRIAALFAMVSLGQIKDDTSYSTAEAFLLSPEVTLRKASMKTVVQFPEKAMTTAKRLIEQSDERNVRVGVELLSALGTPDALALVSPLLIDVRPGVRIQALLALANRVPEPARAEFEARKKDTHHLVRAVAQRLATASN